MASSRVRSKFAVSVMCDKYEQVAGTQNAEVDVQMGHG